MAFEHLKHHSYDHVMCDVLRILERRAIPFINSNVIIDSCLNVTVEHELSVSQLILISFSYEH